MRTFILVMCLSVLSFSSAIGDTTVSSSMVENYLSALRGRNEREILSNWISISADPQTQQFMEENYPSAYSSWRIKGFEIVLAQKLLHYQEIYDATETIPGGDSLQTLVIEVVGPMDNSERAPLNLNQDQPSLREFWLRSIQTVLLDNRTVVLNHPNQERPSNQFIRGNRLKAMIAQQPPP